MAGSLTKSA